MPLRSPSAYDEVITSKKLSTMKPILILSMLKNDPQLFFIVEPTIITFWNDSDISELEPYLNDFSEAAPVVNINSSIRCKGQKYLSNVSREAKHLIEAIKEKKYPLAQCSTYDYNP